MMCVMDKELQTVDKGQRKGERMGPGMDGGNGAVKNGTIGKELMMAETMEYVLLAAEIPETHELKRRMVEFGTFMEVDEDKDVKFSDQERMDMFFEPKFKGLVEEEGRVQIIGDTNFLGCEYLEEL